MNEKKRYIQLLSSNPFSVLIIFLFILSISLVSIQTVNAQEKDNYKVQKITGEIVDTPHFYSLRNMKEGDTLYVYMQRTSKNLDPFVAITDSNLGIQEIQEQYIDAFEAAINAGEEPLEVEGGQTLLSALYANEIFIPSACGGKGSCGFCKITVTSGGGPLLPIEKNLTSLPTQEM